MDRFNLLSVALGLACLAGIDLYLTVFVTGLAIHLHWITLSPSYQSLEVVGQPWVIIIAGILYLLEFFADKVPWIDSAWDAVHTVIRPIGGALLACEGDRVAHLRVMDVLQAGHEVAHLAGTECVHRRRLGRHDAGLSHHPQHAVAVSRYARRSTVSRCAQAGSASG